MPANANWREDDRARLGWLVEHFDRDAKGSRHLIREMLEQDPRRFLGNALAVLREQPETRGSQFVVTLMVANDLLPQALCDPSLSREQAVALARGALRVDSLIDVALVKALVSATPETVSDPGRLMDILDKISDRIRILPSLLRLLRHDDPHIRSKAVLMIGRGSRGVRWVERRMADADARIRANAIESMWGMDRPDARALLHKALRDSSSRVAGNAALGLYMLGDCSSIPEILKMAESDAALERSTAAWVMGETADPRFLAVIAERLQDAVPTVRRRAFRALAKVKEAAAKVAQAPEWRMAALFQPEHGARTRRLRLAVASAQGHGPPVILPTQFLLDEDGRPVNAYRVDEREMPAALSVAFVFPKSLGRAEPPWIKTALHALQWKRNSDLWGLETYRADAGWEGESRISGGGTVFYATADTIRTTFLHPKRASCPDIWAAIWNAVQGQDRLVRGDNRVIVFSNEPPVSAAGQGLISWVISSSTEVQVICTGDSPRLEDFCKKTRGRFLAARGEEEAAKAVEQAYLQLLARYEISYRPLSLQARALKIRAHTPSGWGELTMTIPPEPSG